MKLLVVSGVDLEKSSVMFTNKIYFLGIIFILLALTVAGVRGISYVHFERDLVGSISRDKTANLGIELRDVSAVIGDNIKIPIITFTNRKNDKLLKIKIICIEECRNILKIGSVTSIDRGKSQIANIFLDSHPVSGVSHPLLRIEARWKNSFMITQRRITVTVIEPSPCPVLSSEDGSYPIVMTPSCEGRSP